TVVSVIPAVLGLLGWAGLMVVSIRRRTRTPGRGALIGLGLGAVAYFGVYSVLGVPPYQWYYVLPMAGLALVGVLGLGALGASGVGVGAGVGGGGDAGAQRRRNAVPILLIPLAVLALVASAPGRTLPWTTPPIFGNFATAGQYQQIGSDLSRIVGDARVGSPGEIGTLAFSCECEIIDAFSDRDLVGPLITTRLDASDSVFSKLLELNYHRLHTGQVQPLDYQLLWFPLSVPIPPELAADPQWATNGGSWVGPGTLILTTL
ncbi:MAG: hypothetical protein ACRYF3_08260, partial [Janthinobacterium lividum]